MQFNPGDCKYKDIRDRMLLDDDQELIFATCSQRMALGSRILRHAAVIYKVCWGDCWVIAGCLQGDCCMVYRVIAGCLQGDCWVFAGCLLGDYWVITG